MRIDCEVYESCVRVDTHVLPEHRYLCSNSTCVQVCVPDMTEYEYSNTERYFFPRIVFIYLI